MIKERIAKLFNVKSLKTMGLFAAAALLVSALSACANKDSILASGGGDDNRVVDDTATIGVIPMSIWQNGRGAIGGGAYSNYQINGNLSPNSADSYSYSLGQAAVMSDDPYVYICADSGALIVYQNGSGSDTGADCQGDPALSADGSKIYIPQSDGVYVDDTNANLSPSKYYDNNDNISLGSDEWAVVKADSKGNVYLGTDTEIHLISGQQNGSKLGTISSGLSQKTFAVNEEHNIVIAILENSDEARRAYYYDSDSNSWKALDTSSPEVALTADAYYGDKKNGKMQYIDTLSSSVESGDTDISGGVLYISDLVTTGDALFMDYSYRVAPSEAADVLDDLGLNTNAWISYPRRSASGTQNPAAGESQSDLEFPQLAYFTIDTAGKFDRSSTTVLATSLDSYGALEGLATDGFRLRTGVRDTSDNDNLMIASPFQEEDVLYQSYQTLMERRALTMYLEYCWDVTDGNCSWYGRGFLFDSAAGEDYNEHFPGDTNSIVLRPTNQLSGEIYLPHDKPYEWFVYWDQLANEWTNKNGNIDEISSATLPYVTDSEIGYNLGGAEYTIEDYTDDLANSDLYHYDSSQTTPVLGYDDSINSSSWEGEYLGNYIANQADWSLFANYINNGGTVSKLTDVSGTSIDDYVDNDSNYEHGSLFVDADSSVASRINYSVDNSYLLWKFKETYTDRDLQFKTEVATGAEINVSKSTLSNVSYTDYGLDVISYMVAQSKAGDCNVDSFILATETDNGVWDLSGNFDGSENPCPNTGYFTSGGNSYDIELSGELYTFSDLSSYNIPDTWNPEGDSSLLESSLNNWPQQYGFGADYRWDRYGTIASLNLSDQEVSIAGTQSAGTNASSPDSSPYNWYSEIGASSIISPPVIAKNGWTLFAYVDKDTLWDGDANDGDQIKLVQYSADNSYQVKSILTLDSDTESSKISPPLITADGNVYVFTEGGAVYVRVN